MTIPAKIKRVTVQSQTQLRSWLTLKAPIEGEVMLVTKAGSSHPSFVSRDQIAQMTTEFGWDIGFRYTLSGNLLGHVIKKNIARA